MAIYDFSKLEKNEFKTTSISQNSYDSETSCEEEKTEEPPNQRGQFFSSLAARLLFLLLLVADLIWTGYTLTKISFSLLGTAISLGRMPYFRTLREKAWISLRRSLICAVSLFIALFSPSFGIMIACTYFLMYDKSGIEEVVPSSLQSQFKEFLPKE